MIRALAIILAFPAFLHAWTKNGTTYTTDGSQSDVESALADASEGDIVQVPSGSYTWGASSNSVDINTAVTLQGAGTASTMITISDSAGTFTNGTIVFRAAATVKDMTVAGSANTNRTPFAAYSPGGWRLTNVIWEPDTGVGGYFFYVNSYGLIDNCDISLQTASTESIFIRGPTDSWTTAHSLGGADNVFIEDNIFRDGGSGSQIHDANSNARVVTRFNTIIGKSKADGHGLASNSPARGVRHMEIYHNEWQNTGNYWTSVEVRGGTGYVFENTFVNDDAIHPWFTLTDYGATATWSNFDNTYQTPDNYPIGDQVGTGIDETINATALSAGQMARINTAGTTDFTLIGAADNNAGTQFIATGAGTGTGTADVNTLKPMYLWQNNNSGTHRDGLPIEFTWKSIPAGATTEYGASFTMYEDIIVADRDFFVDIPANETYGTYTPSRITFDGSSGVGRGTKSEMDAITGTTTGVGFWVTDEGEWNSDSAGADGQLYVWDGDSWELEYTPYTYPHPLRTEAAGPGTVYTGEIQLDGSGAQPSLSSGALFKLN